MRSLRVLLLLPLVCAAQTTPAPPLVRGVVLERDAQVESGQFSVRAPDNHVYRYQFDSKTYVERDSQAVEITRLNPGDKVEVLSDSTAGAALRYARTVHVLEEPARPAQSLGRVRTSRSTPLTPAISSADRLSNASTLTYSGIVARVSPDRLVLRLRTGGDQTILLRKDTRFLEDGEGANLADLRPNMRVFVRAGKDVYQQAEAYQVVWGTLLGPK